MCMTGMGLANQAAALGDEQEETGNAAGQVPYLSVLSYLSCCICANGRTQFTCVHYIHITTTCTLLHTLLHNITFLSLYTLPHTTMAPLIMFIFIQVSASGVDMSGLESGSNKLQANAGPAAPPAKKGIFAAFRSALFGSKNPDK